MPDALIELFSEEIPARMQARAADDLKRLVTEGLVAAGLTYAHARAYATPRRLLLAVEGLAAESPTRREERKGPKVGAPEQALLGFLRSTGLSRDQLLTREDKKGAVYLAVIEQPGRPAAAILAEVLEGVIRNFPWPKSMRWGSGSLRWVRPLQSILCLLTDEAGAQVVPLSVDGITAGDSTEGHRFMAPGRFAVTGFEDYADRLRRAFVMLDAQERMDVIAHEMGQRAFALGLEPVADRALLAEVAGLVEWPVVLVGEIGAQFLDLPPEVLQTSMREHQKFFSLRDPKTGQIVRFVTVANRETLDGGATILAGNQKVLAARLSDAKFFWENDLRNVRQSGMEAMAEGLANVTFHNKLGSQKDRISRIEALAHEIAPLVGAEPGQAALAARVAKADLRSEMVGEFPELQGLMGSYYVREQGLPDAVARACREHYQPLGPGDSVPTSPVSVAVALADKIDTLTGFWAIDEKPTGSKDPYALRRAALGVIRLVLGNGVRVALVSLTWGVFDRLENALARANMIQGLQSLGEARIEPNPRNDAKFVRTQSFYKDGSTLIDFDDETFRACKSFGNLFRTVRFSVEKPLAEFEKYRCNSKTLCDDLLTFLHDRLKVHLRDQGIRHDVIDACLAMPGNDDLMLLVNRAEALGAFLQTDDGENLIQGFKRANNILTQAEQKDGVEYSFGPDPKLADTPEERTLFAALDQAETAIAPAMGSEDFPAAMAAMAGLRAPIDAFFEAVQINTDNAILRRNRLNLLHRIRATCLQVAELTRIEG